MHRLRWTPTVCLLAPIISTAQAIAATSAASPRYLFGVASVVITPPEPMWAGGYASRTHPVSETLQDLYAKALVLQDSDGQRLVIVTTDLLGLPRSIAEPTAARIARKLKVNRAQILLNSSHTHCGPVLRESLVDIYPMGDRDWEVVRRYSAWLQDRLVEVAARAAEHPMPARISTGVGRATFAVNRRTNKEAEVVPGYEAKGPVDHDVPVLSVHDEQGRPQAVLFGYACHNTTMGFYQWSGDYAGYAQADLQARYPGVTALFVQGCGGDSNPLPRRKIELCQDYGRQLATAVEKVLDRKLAPIHGPLAARMEVSDLPLADLPGRPQLELDAAGKNPQSRPAFARRMLKLLDAGESLPTSYPYPVQVMQVGTKLTIVALGGEVVVDYSLRLKKELGADRTWVLGYSNDVMAYIPSRRVLAEGGYEGATSMPLYGLPGRWSPAIEELIVGTVHKLADQVRAATQPAMGRPASASPRISGG